VEIFVIKGMKKTVMVKPRTKYIPSFKVLRLSREFRGKSYQRFLAPGFILNVY